MKTIVIYKSKTGFTEKYARLIASALGAELRKADNVSAASLKAFDTIIFGGGLYVGGINGLKIITKNFDILKNKKIIVFATGATPFREETNKQLLEMNFTPEQQKILRFFYLRGGFNFSKLGIVDKILMSLLKLKLRVKPASKRSPDEKGMLEAYARPCDFFKEKYYEPLIEYALETK